MGGSSDIGLRGVVWPLAWLAGIALQLQQVTLWGLPPYAACAGGGALLFLAAWRARRGGLPLGALAAALLGFAVAGLQAVPRLAEALPAGLEGQDLVVIGTVARLPQNNLTGTRFVFDIDSARWRGEAVQVPRRVSLGWYRGPDDDALLIGPQHDLRAGQRWQLTVRLRQPHGSLNPGGFDLELWLFEQGVRAGGYVRSRAGDVALKLDESAGHPIERLRQDLRDRIDAAVPDRAAAGVLAALAIGDQQAIDRADWDVFRATGVAHLMSISGLHVTMFAWLAGVLLQRLWRLSPAAMRACPAPTAARWGGLIAAASYALLAGWGVPAQRTVWMIAVVVLLRSLAVRWPQPMVLAAAAVVVSAFDPWALLQPGFWLSFAAVALLIASDPVAPARAVAAVGRMAALRQLLAAGLRTQVVATVALTPLTLVFFQQVSLIGFLANLVAIPLVTLAITPLALLGTLVPGCWALASALVGGLMLGLGELSRWPLAVFSAAAAPAWAAAAGLLAGAVLVMPLPWRLRLLGVPLMLPLLFPPVPRPAEGRFELVAADVGQGTAVLVRTRAHLLVYDAGPQYSPEADAGQRVLLPLLRHRGETRIDLLMLSHRDSDHVGGAATLLGALPVVAMSSSLADDHPLRQSVVPHRRCEAGQRWHWDGVDFEVLQPNAEGHALAVKPNALSCVLKVSGASSSALLTGDIEAAQEATLVERSGAGLRSDVLLVPHHGSRTSSTPAFVDAVAPRVAVVQAGYRSRFGHPAPDVVERYLERGIEVVRSDRCGAWTQAADGLARCERRVSARYWHHRPPGLPVEPGPR